jgi:ribosome maturation factor RimP
VVQTTRVSIPGFLLWLFDTLRPQLRPEAGVSVMERALISSLWTMIEPVLEPEGIELVEVEFKMDSGRWILRLYIDLPGGVSLDDCELVSRQVGALLDIKNPIEQPYHLEVKTRRKVAGRRNFSGVLKGMEDSWIVLEVDGKRVEIDPEDVEKAQLHLPEADLFRNDLRRRAVSTGD